MRADEVGLRRVVEQRDGVRGAEERRGQVRDVEGRVRERHLVRIGVRVRVRVRVRFKRR